MDVGLKRDDSTKSKARKVSIQSVRSETIEADPDTTEGKPSEQDGQQTGSIIIPSGMNDCI